MDAYLTPIHHKNRFNRRLPNRHQASTASTAKGPLFAISKILCSANGSIEKNHVLPHSYDLVTKNSSWWHGFQTNSAQCWRCKKLGDYSSLPNQPYPFNMRLPITPIADYDVSFPNLLVEPPFLQKAKLLLKCTQIIVLTITNAFWKYRFNSESDAFVA